MQFLCISKLVFSRKLHTKRAYHPIFNRFLFGFQQVTGQLKSCNMIIYHQHKISDRYIGNFMPYIGLSRLWLDFDRGPHWAKSQNWNSRVFSLSPWNFWSIEHNHALYWKFEILAGLGSRPQAQMVLKPFEGALTCSILIAGTQVMLRTAYFLRRESWLRPKSWTPRPWIRNSGPFYWDAHTNGLMCKISAL
jgi:hypothetical protein